MPVVNSNRQIVYFVLPLKNFESSIRPFTGPRMDGEERVGVMVSSSLQNLRMGSTTEVVARLCRSVDEISRNCHNFWRMEKFILVESTYILVLLHLRIY